MSGINFCMAPVSNCCTRSSATWVSSGPVIMGPDTVTFRITLPASTVIETYIGSMFKCFAMLVLMSANILSVLVWLAISSMGRSTIRRMSFDARVGATVAGGSPAVLGGAVGNSEGIGVG